MALSNEYSTIKKRIKIRDLFEGEIIDVSSGWKALCPFHSDTDPSFSVTELDTGDLYYCHGCKRGGDVISFVQEYKHYEQREAFRYLAEKAGLDVSTLKFPEDELAPVLKNLVTNHSFFQQKNIPEHILRKFGVGYIGDINKLDIDPNLMLKWKLSMVGNSIFYPIKGRNGLLAGYYIRPMYNSQSKYIGNSPLHVFGLQMLEDGGSHVLAVEGFNDVMKLWSRGIKNVIGICGTNFNEGLMRTVSEHGIRHLVFVPDADAGGLGMVNQIVDKYGTFDTHGVSVGYAIIPKKGCDPDDYVDVDPDFFKEISKHEISPIVTYFDDLDMWNWTKISDIVTKKRYLSSYEIQLALRERLGGIVDIRAIATGLYDDKAEHIIIGNMLADSTLKNKMKSTLLVEYFSIPEYGRAFQFIKDNDSVSIETLKEELGIEFNKKDIMANDLYVNRLLELYRRRKMFETISRYNYEVCDRRATVDVIMQNMVNELSKMTNVSSGVVTADGVVLTTIDSINSDKYDGIPYNDKFPETSGLTRGLPIGKFFIAAGNSGEGKTSFALNVLDSVAVRQKNRALMLSGEMVPEELMLRMFSIHSGLSYDGILDRRHTLEESQYKALATKRLIFAPLPFIEDVYSCIKSIHLQYGGIRLVVIDYLQLMISKNTNGGIKRYQELKNLTITLKNLAMELGISVLGVAQQNKTNLNSEVSKIENLAGGYDMVQDADVGITLKKKNTTNSVTDGNAEINVDKLRYGMDDILIKVYYNTSNLRMTEVTAVGRQQ